MLYKNALSLHVKEIEKSFLCPGPETDQSQSPTNSSLAEGLSIYKIRFKSVNNVFRYLAHRQTDRQTDTQTKGITIHNTSATRLTEAIRGLDLT